MFEGRRNAFRCEERDMLYIFIAAQICERWQDLDISTESGDLIDTIAGSRG